MTDQLSKCDPVTVVIIAYNEAATIEAEIRALHEAIVSHIPGSELIVAEDGSTDGTKEIIFRLIDELGIIHSTSNERKGYVKALKDAFGIARCPYIFFSDSGYKHNPEEFWNLYPLRKDHAMVVGVKAHRTDQWYRKFLTWIYNRILSFYFKVNLRDADSGFRLYDREVVQKVFNEEWINRELINSEITLRIIYSGYSVKELSTSYKQRIGVSRGMPNKKIPAATYGVLRNFPKLRRTLTAPGYRIGPVK